MVVDYREELSSQIPAVRLLMALGYQYLTPAEALELRGGRNRAVVLDGVLEPWLRDHNRVVHKGRTVPFSDTAIRDGVRRLTDLPPSAGLVMRQRPGLRPAHAGHLPAPDPSRRYPPLLAALHRLAAPRKQRLPRHGRIRRRARRLAPDPPPRHGLLRQRHPPGGHRVQTPRPANVKDGGLPYEEAISQHLRNQKEGEIRPLFAYCPTAAGAQHQPRRLRHRRRRPRNSGRPGRKKTPHRTKPAAWLLINQPAGPAEIEDAFYDWREHSDWVRREFAGQGRTPAHRAGPHHPQPARPGPPAGTDLPVHALRRRDQEDRPLPAVFRRQGHARTGGRPECPGRAHRRRHLAHHRLGQVAHMVMLAKALALHPNVPNPRVILVTDRINLDNQIYSTFQNCGKTIVQAKSGRHLIELVQSRQGATSSPPSSTSSRPWPMRRSRTTTPTFLSWWTRATAASTA